MIRDFIPRELLIELIAKHLGVAAVSLAWKVEGGEFKGATIIATIETPGDPPVNRGGESGDQVGSSPT